MKSRFQNADLLVRTTNGLDDTLVESLVFERESGELLRAPIGTTTDGGSVPRIFQNIFPPCGEPDYFPFVLHDAGYRRQLEVWCDAKQDWLLANYTQKQCDDLLLEAMVSQGVNAIKRQVIYLALRLFGGKAFREDRA